MKRKQQLLMGFIVAFVLKSESDQRSLLGFVGNLTYLLVFKWILTSFSTIGNKVPVVHSLYVSPASREMLLF